MRSASSFSACFLRNNFHPALPFCGVSLKYPTYKIENNRVYFNAGFWSWSADIVDDELIDNDDVYTKISQ